jgi:hypothetical protein
MSELARWITALRVEDAALLETPAETRERLKALFPAGATRRMTQLGIALGSTLHPLAPDENDTLVYASTYAETRALEGYLDSFPAPSPTLFQTSIHPGSVQQNLIQRQQPVRQFFPVTGAENLPASALLVALLAETPRVILCGGEERGGWLLEQNRASDRTFAFALALSNSPAGALGHVSLSYSDPQASGLKPPPSPFSLPLFFEHLRDRRPFDAFVSPGPRLVLRWLP